MINLSEKMGNYERMEMPSGDKSANYLTSSIQRLSSRQHKFVRTVMDPLNNQTRFQNRNICLNRCVTSISNLESFMEATHKIEYGFGHKLSREEVVINKWTPCVSSQATFAYCPNPKGDSNENLFFILEISVAEKEKQQDQRQILSLLWKDFPIRIHDNLSHYINVYYQYDIKLINDYDLTTNASRVTMYDESFTYGTNEQITSEVKDAIAKGTNLIDCPGQQFAAADRMLDVLDNEFKKRDMLKK